MFSFRHRTLQPMLKKFLIMKFFNLVVFLCLFVGLVQGLSSEELDEIKMAVFKEVFESEAMKSFQKNL